MGCLNNVALEYFSVLKKILFDAIAYVMMLLSSKKWGFKFDLILNFRILVFIYDSKRNWCDWNGNYLMMSCDVMNTNAKRYFLWLHWKKEILLLLEKMTRLKFYILVDNQFDASYWITCYDAVGQKMIVIVGMFYVEWIFDYLFGNIDYVLKISRKSMIWNPVLQCD